MTRLALGFCLLLWFCGSAEAAAIGTLQAALNGPVAAQGDAGPPRLLARGSPVANGETLSTGKAFGVLRLADGTEITLRPDTRLTLRRAPRGGGKPQLRLQVERGGVRIVSDERGQHSSDRLLLITPDGEVRPRGTDFEARLCADDCQREVQQARRGAGAGAGRGSDDSPVIARVVFLRGRGTARKPGGRQRTLALGASLFERDEVNCAERSTLSIAFLGGQRASLKPGTSLLIEQWSAEQQAGVRGGLTDAARLRLLRGGMRLLKGLKARERARQLEVATGNGDIRLESEGVDLSCTGDCAQSNRDSSLGPAWPSLQRFAATRLLDLLIPPASARSTGRGLVAEPWGGGQVLLRTREGVSRRIASGEVFQVADGAKPQQLPGWPADIPFGTMPRPDLPQSIDPRMRPQQLFGGIVQNTPRLGLYVRVIGGDVTVAGQRGRLDLGPGESGFSAAGAGTDRLAQPPPLLRTPSPQRLTRLATRLQIPGTSDARSELDRLRREQCLTR